MTERPRFFDDLAGVAGGAMSELAANAKAGQEVAEAQLREISERLAALEIRVAALETPKPSA